MFQRIVLAIVLGMMLVLPKSVPASASSHPVPVFAYYYIWFTPGSWERAKTDYPLLGRYSSDDATVMRRHVQMAKQVGIDGFIVSWKSTEPLDRRLEQLIDIAEAEDFKLAIIYQGLNFERQPLPVSTIASDLDIFIDRYASRAAFDVFALPLVIWSGTWEFSPEEVAQVTASRRSGLLILASERNVEGYQRLATTVDGNAYYWSSVDPDTTPDYQEKLDTMAVEIHDHGGLWIAPAAPGFDARMIGGWRVIDRLDGLTLRRQFSVAMSSQPDMIGLISWNEFSENSHVEPSVNHGSAYLTVIADILGAQVPDLPFFASDEIYDDTEDDPVVGDMGLVLVLVFSIVTLGCAAIVVRRSARQGRE